MSILLISGSPAYPSSSSRLLQHFAEQLEASGHHYQYLHLRELPAQSLLLGQRRDAVVDKALQAVAKADHIVLATPIYNASYTGLLKCFLDLLPQNGLAGKVILPMASAGSAAHLLALDYALRPVLQALDARHVLSSIFVAGGDMHWSEAAGVTLSPAIAERVEAGLSALAWSLGRAQKVTPERTVNAIAD